MSNRQTIAGVVLTLNEEHDLARSLRSLSWCDELLVVDSGSTDNTCAIAQTYGARVLVNIQPPPFLISNQRNWALDNGGLSSDWVLFLDADEEVGPHLIEMIHENINSSQPYNSYFLAPRFWFLGKWLKHTQSYPNWHPRLVLRGQAYFDGGVWETFSQDALSGRILTPYEHYSFSKGIDDWILKHIRYADWESQYVFSRISCAEPSSFIIRKALIRSLAARLWPVRPLLVFFSKFFIQRGFLDGWQSVLYCLLISTYELIIVIKVIQLQRRTQGLSL